MSNEEIVTCKTCVHCFVTEWPKFMASEGDYRCKLEWSGKQEVNIVTGKTTDTREFIPCFRRRTLGYVGLDGECGKEGKQWTPKNKKDLFKLIKRM